MSNVNGESHVRYTSNQAVALSGATARELQWWDERRIVHPTQEGHKRLYTPWEVVKASVIVDLRRQGIGLALVRNILRGALNEVPASRAEDLYLVVYGTRAVVAEGAEDLLRIVKRAQCAVVLVFLSEHIRKCGLEIIVPRATRTRKDAGRFRRAVA